MAEVVFDHVTRIYPGNDKPSVDDLNMTIKDGEFLVLVGPSGCMAQRREPSMDQVSKLWTIDTRRCRNWGHECTPFTTDRSARTCR